MPVTRAKVQAGMTVCRTVNMKIARRSTGGKFVVLPQ